MIISSDIAFNLYKRHKIWFIKPRVILRGEDGKFGKLFFDFGGSIIGYNIYIYPSRDYILRVAQEAIDNFKKIVEGLRDNDS